MISIICLIHNNDKPSPTLLSSIDSVIGQTYQEWELKLVFYNTQAPAPTIIPTFEDKRIEVKNYGEEFKTYVQTLLHVVNNDAVYNHIGILDVNDIWEPNKLELQVAKLKEFPRIDVIGTKSKYDTGDGLEPEIPINGLYNYNLFKVNPFINSSVVFKRDVLRYMQKPVEEIETEIEIGNEAATVNVTGAAQPHSPHPCPVMLFVSYTILTKCIFAISVRDMTATASVNGSGKEIGTKIEVTEIVTVIGTGIATTGTGIET